jgi:TonB-dependent starch-binding outer membrane protein SusC
MKKQILLFIFFTFSFCANLIAQERQISGVVTSSEDGSPLPGVNIAVKGTSRGTTTGADGSYKISVGN